MGSRGTKTVPTAIRLARGTHVPSRHGDPKQEPQGALLLVAPDAPESLGETGAKKWKSWCERLITLKLLEDRYLDALEMYCRAWDSLAVYEAVLKDEGEFFTTEKGFICRHPAATGAKQAREEIRRYQGEFGLTPSSSTGVKLSTTGKASGVPNRRKDVG
jgi:P27 family predicted phage terminase small subunit